MSQLKEPSSLLAATEDKPSFGMMIRAARLGFHWSARHGCFIRLSVRGSHAAFELHPNQLISGTNKLGQPFVCWWEDSEMLDHVPQLRHVRRVKRPVYFEVPLSLEIGS